MAETRNSQLERKRFVINPESITGMKNLRATFQDLKQDYPYLSGLGFFGSRTKGTEHDESDYDLYIFYNSEKIDPSIRTSQVGSIFLIEGRSKRKTIFQKWRYLRSKTNREYAQSKLRRFV